MPETQPQNQHCMNCGHVEKWPDSLLLLSLRSNFTKLLHHP